MAFIYRASLGRNLTAAEGDANFAEAESRLAELETDRPQPDEFSSVALAGTQLSFYLESGTQLGPVTLPVLRWRWRDEWLPSTIYAALDVFKVEGEGIFLTLLDHTSAGTFDPNATSGGNPIYDQLISVLDVAGTPVTNDILVHDGTSWVPTRARYVVGFSSPQTDPYDNAQVVGHHPAAVGITFPANFGAYLGWSSRAGGTVDATGSTVISIDKCLAANDPATEGDWTQIGTITIGAGSVTPTLATVSGAAQTLAAGDRLRAKMPSSADATFAGFFCTLVAFET